MEIARLWQQFLDIAFPLSERAARVTAHKDDPLPCAPHAKIIGKRTVTILASYDDTRVRDAICALKFERNQQSLGLLSHLLNDFLMEQLADEALFGKRLVCVPIPLGKKRLSERGINQIEAVIAQTQIVKSGAVSIAHALVRTRETLQQSTLPRPQRIENVRGAFSVSPQHISSLTGASVLLIDDVTTTGATLLEAAYALENEGIQVELLALAG